MSDSSRASSFAEPTHTPQGDVNLRSGAQLIYQPGTNSHPARGRKWLYFNVASATNGTNSHPARGRKDYQCHFLVNLTMNQLTPREGTIILRLDTYSPDSDESTHTPQGDGNKFQLWYTHYHNRFNSHPARGQTNRRNFSALHRCGRKVPSAFLIFCTVFQPGTAAEPFSECKTETPETKGKSL